MRGLSVVILVACGGQPIDRYPDDSSGAYDEGYAQGRSDLQGELDALTAQIDAIVADNQALAGRLDTLESAGFVTEAWVTDQDYGSASALTAAQTDIVTNTATIETLQSDVVTADWLTTNGYATEDWANAAINAVQDEVDLLGFDIALVEARLTTVQSDYLTSTDTALFATTDWVASQQYLSQSTADGLYVVADDITELLELEEKLEVDGKEVVLTNANLHLRNGSEVTSQGNGSGNLILGYNLDDGQRSRLGSHNLVVGDLNSYDGSAGIVSGYASALDGDFAAVIGGQECAATSDYAVTIGGLGNVASGDRSVAMGGKYNEASALWATTVGGSSNHAASERGLTAGGNENTTTGVAASVVGAWLGTASAKNALVTGGMQNEAAGNYSVVGWGDGRTVTDLTGD